MPKLKKNSYQQKKKKKRINQSLARIVLRETKDIVNKNSISSCSIQEVKKSINRQLRTRGKCAAHREQDKLCRRRSLLSPTKHNIHKERLKAAQRKRLLSPTKRTIHHERLKTAQGKRLLSPTKRTIHQERLKAAQGKRLLSPTRRTIHQERLKSAQRKRLLSPTKRTAHRVRDKSTHHKRLLSPTKRAIHQERLRSSQRKRLCDPKKRKEHLDKLGKLQKERLKIAAKRNEHLARLRRAQQKRLQDPAGRILHVSRVLASKLSKEQEKSLNYRKNLFKSFLDERKQGPTHNCASCHRLWFKSSIKYRNIDSFDLITLSAACGPVEGDTINLCSSCYNSMRSRKMPTFSLGNKDLCFPDIPEEIESLTELEERFICPRIPFMSIRATVSDQQLLVKGRAVNVPIEVPTTVNILPRAISETQVVAICFKRKKCFKSNIAFEYVRPHIIKKAALFLQTSPVYKHFNIVLDMHHMGDVTFQQKSSSRIEETTLHEDQEEDDELLEDIEPLNIADDETLLANAILFTPGEGQKPESLFAEFVEAQSFIKIYGGELIQQPKGMTYQQWVKSEIMRDDRRCATVTKLFFSALKLRVSKMSSSISFCLRKKKTNINLSAQHLLDNDNMKELEVHDSGFRVFAADRGAPAYWELKKKELFAMMRQLGPPTFFLTLSPAETRWPELIVILKSVVDNVVISEEEVPLMDYQEKVRLVKNDPVTVARYFEYRMRRLFNILKQDCSVFREHKVIDYYIRTEFQQRGSPHLHCLLWLKDAPVYHEDNLDENVTEFIDNFITCSSLISADILELQTHKHTFTCKKGLKKKERKCRFDIPFFPVSKTVILCPLTEKEVTKEEQTRMRKLRNEIQESLFHLHKHQKVKTINELISDFALTYEEYVLIIRSGLNRITVFLKHLPQECMINSYNSEILLLHEANMDIQYITDMYSCATYILNYLNKSNSGMSKLLREAAAEIRHGNYSMREHLRMLGNFFLNASEFSAQEAVFYIMALPLSSSSRHCQFINTNPPEKRVSVVKSKFELEKLPPNSKDIFVKNVLDHYVQRPTALESNSLADFVAWYNFSTKSKKKTFHREENVDCEDSTSECSESESSFQLIDKTGYVQRRRKAKVIRYVNYSEHNDEFIRENVMLFHPWRDEQIMSNTAAEVYKSNLIQIKETRAKYVFNEALIGALQDAEERYRDNSDSEPETETPNNLRVFAVDSQISRLPDKDIDKTVCPGSGKGFGDDVVLPIPNMVSENEYCEIISTLNCKQRIFLLHVLHLFKKNSLPFYHCVLGGAGVGKSRLINAIQQTILRWLNKEGTELDKLKILLCAPTGKAAFAIKGTTLHSAFVLPLNQCAVDLVPLSSATRNSVWSKMKDVKLIIIDEISMVGSRMIQQVDCRLKEIFKSSQPFAGLSLLVLGDFNQLPPVGDRYIFQSHLCSTYGELIGNPLWELFSSFMLTEIMRQKDDAQFAMALNNLAEGTLDDVQKKLFKERIFNESRIPQKAIHLFKTNAEVDSFNSTIINKDPRRLMVEAVDKVTGQPNEKVNERLLKAAKSSAAKDSQGLPFHLELSINIKYMITVNVDVEDGLVNGAVGILKQIDLGSDSSVVRLWLLFPSDIGNKRRKELQHQSEAHFTAINQVVRIIKPCKSPHSVVRRQFPLVPAEAMTIYKSQGGTYDNVAVHLNSRLRRSELYVALSRCTKLSGLYLSGHFTAPVVTNANKKVLSEIKRLSNKPILISCLFPSMFPAEITIVYQNVESLTKKSHWADLKNFVRLNKPTIFIAAETWTILDDNLSIEEYNILLRLDSSHQRNAYGLVVYVRKDEAAHVVFTYNNETKGEVCCLATFIYDDFAIFTGYKPPSTLFSKVVHILEEGVNIGVMSAKKCIILGDFNFNMNNKPLHPFYCTLERKGFCSQLHTGTSTTNAMTSIDCAWANFDHVCGVIETLYSHHKALISVPNLTSAQFPPLFETSKTPASAAVLLPVSTPPSKPSESVPPHAISLQEAIIRGKHLFQSLASKAISNDEDKTELRVLVAFMRQGTNFTGKKRQMHLQLPSHINDYFNAIETTGDGNCFYNAVSLLLCGKQSLAPGLRAIVAHHFEINDEFIESLPLFVMPNENSRSLILTNGNYAEITEVLLMSYILRRPINVYARSLSAQIRFAPCSSPSELHLFLDMSHYTALKLKRNKTPSLPDPILHLPSFENFTTYL